MIGPRAGVRVGPMGGVRVGVGTDPIAPQGPGYEIDATSEIATPATLAEWSRFIAANSLSVSEPDSLWLCQDSSGDLADAIGGVAFPDVGSGHLYQQTVSGWSRKAVGTTNASGQRWEISNFANTATTSVCLLAFIQNLTTPVASAGLVGMGTSTTQYGAVFLSGTTTVRARSTNLKDGAANAFGTSAIRPVVILVDVTGSRTRYYSDTEKLEPTYAACAGTLLTLGPPGGGNSISGRYLYACAWKGADAEISDANVKAMLEAMGWTIGWS